MFFHGLRENTQAAKLFVQYLTETATMGPDNSTGRGGCWVQFGTSCRLINASQVPHRLRCDSSWLGRVGKKPSLKADLAIYSYIVTVSGQHLNVAIMLSNKMDFRYCDNMVSFC